MSITLLCLVKGNTTASAFAVDIDRKKLVSHLKDAIKEKKQNDFAGIDADRLKLWKVSIPGDQDDQLRNLILQNSDELLAINDIGDYWPTSPPKKHIHVIVKLPLLSLEEALSCIPLSITYSPDCTKSKTTTKVNGDPPTSVQLWGDFFDKVNQFCFDQQPIFERPQFSQDREVDNEEDVRDALNSNICLVLNRLMGSEYKFSRRPPNTPGVPDFTCHLVGSLILVIEAKRKHVLEDMGEQTFPEFYNTSKGKDVIQQIYNYMGGNELRYGILTTYDNHWFLCREHTKLWISKTLSLESESLPILKAYAYLTRQAKENPNSPKPQVLVPAQGDNNSCTLRSNSKSSSSSSLTNQASSTFSNQQSSSNVPVNQQKFSFADFKFKSILGEG
ncbi:kinase-like domain-containing protein [Rhizophagus irregularis DAOM 181602=DAOM 197198]|nr:kinase-like domain-containing protein [Rhizophagus irregularis DAOM 181602=DAOM 197198]